jgi:hypothetical protein
MNSPASQTTGLPGLERTRNARLAHTRALKDLVRKHCGLEMEAPVFIAEITCGETDCPDAETVIAILEGQTRREFRLLKPVSAITGADIAEALNK